MSGTNYSITVITKKVGGISVVSLVKPGVSVTPVGRGLQGPMGPAGLDGVAGSNNRYEHSQPSAASAWTVNHNLGYRPQVQALSVGGMALLAEVLHTSGNQALVYFDVPTAGLALCS